MVSLKSFFILSLSATFSTDTTEGPPSVGVAKVVFWKQESSEKKMVTLTVSIRDGRVFQETLPLTEDSAAMRRLRFHSFASNTSIKINGIKYQVFIAGGFHWKIKELLCFVGARWSALFLFFILIG